MSINNRSEITNNSPHALAPIACNKILQIVEGHEGKMDLNNSKVYFDLNINILVKRHFKPLSSSLFQKSVNFSCVTSDL